MSNNSSIGEFRDIGRAYVEYPQTLRVEVEKAVRAWEAFCRLDERVRTQFPYNSAAGMGVGYELKKIKAANRDAKEDFHITETALPWLSDTAWHLKNPVILEFIQNAKSLTNAVAPLIEAFAKEAEETFLISGLAEEVRESRQDQWFVRFLHYFGGSAAGDEIATPHADKSGFTLHLYESDPGLQYLDFKKKWQEMPVSAGETAIIPGMRMQYRSGNNIKATYHRVIANEQTAVRGRFSVVCFVHLKNTPAYDKARAGRLQDFEPGFNYKMPFESFKQLFT